jgi:hypothetical protein
MCRGMCRLHEFLCLNHGGVEQWQIGGWAPPGPVTALPAKSVDADHKDQQHVSMSHLAIFPRALTVDQLKSLSEDLLSLPSSSPNDSMATVILPIVPVTPVSVATILSPNGTTGTVVPAAPTG